MTWELGYFYGLASGGAAGGLIGLFVHAGYWERWTRQLAEAMDERQLAIRAANRWEGRVDDAEAAAARIRIERDDDRRAHDECHDLLDKALAENYVLREMAKNDSRVHDVLEMGKRLEGVSRNAGVHAAGVVIEAALPSS